MPTPEDKARENIDRLLTQAGWAVRDQSDSNILAYRGVAIRNFTLKRGPVSPTNLQCLSRDTHVTVRRTQIELSLEDLIRSQKGFEFQSLAVHLAKQNYPDLEPTEWFNDGSDVAISAPIAGGDRVRRSLACSLSGTWDKVRRDCERIGEMKVEIDILIFYTPVGVSNVDISKWQERVRKRYSHELDVVGRARIVSSLEQPKTHGFAGTIWGCRLRMSQTSRCSGQRYRKLN